MSRLSEVVATDLQRVPEVSSQIPVQSNIFSVLSKAEKHELRTLGASNTKARVLVSPVWRKGESWLKPWPANIPKISAAFDYGSNSTSSKSNQPAAMSQLTLRPRTQTLWTRVAANCFAWMSSGISRDLGEEAE